jgi:hypothetical protein
VINVQQWDGNIESWRPPEDCSAVRSDVANIGDSLDGSTFIRPPPKERERSQLDKLLDALAADNKLTLEQVREIRGR